MPTLLDLPSELRLEIYKAFFLILPTEDLMLPMHVFPLLRTSYLLAVEGLEAAISIIAVATESTFEKLVVASEQALSSSLALGTADLADKDEARAYCKACSDCAQWLQVDMTDLEDIAARLRRRLEFVVSLRS